MTLAQVGAWIGDENRLFALCRLAHGWVWFWDLDDPEALDKILAEAIDLDSFKNEVRRAKSFYAPNEQIPFTGWAKEMWGNGQVKVLVQSKEERWTGN